MARPVNPKAVRRLEEGAPIEVLTTAGHWVDYSLLSETSKANVDRALLDSGRPRTMPHTSFEWTFSPMSKDVYEPVRDTERTERTDTRYDIEVEEDSDEDSDDNDDDTDDDTDEQPLEDSEPDEDKEEAPQPQPQPQPQRAPSPMEMMMEDIIRRIADELDEERQDLVDEKFARVQTLIDEAIKNHQPTDGPNTRLVPVTTQVVVTTPTTTVTKDGLFHQQFDDLLANIVAGIHTALPGPPGSGKSHSAEQAADCLGWPFGAISLGPTTPESRLWGGMDANGRFHEPPLIAGIRHAMANPDSGFVYCLDEADNAHAGIIATTNSAKANGWVFAPNGDKLILGSNVVFIMAMNTYGTGPTAEFAGRNKLDPATLDRYAYIPWDTDLAMEEVLVRQRIADPLVATAWLDAWRTLRANVESYGLKFFVTMRGAINGAKIIAAGRPLDKAMMLVAGNKIPADQWAKVNPL